MITQQDLQEAIAECEGQKNPNANTCIKLAAFYTIREHMFGGTPEVYSFSPGIQNTVSTGNLDPPYNSDTEFMSVVNSIGINATLPVVDELMTTLSVINPKLYASVIRKLDRV